MKRLDRSEVFQNREFRVMPAQDVDPYDWEIIQGLQFDALSNALEGKRSSDEVAYVLHMDDLDRYIAGRVDPSIEVREGRMLAGNEYRNPTVITASKRLDGSEDQSQSPTVGYLYVAENVSGSNPLVRKMKWKMPPYTYAWAREIAVAPPLQRQGIAKQMALLALDDYQPNQEVACYVWEESRSVLDAAWDLGMERTGVSDPRPVFGEDKWPVKTSRLVIKVSDLRLTLNEGVTS